MAAKRASSPSGAVPSPPRIKRVKHEHYPTGSKPGRKPSVWVTLNLRYRHFVVNTAYMPGVVRVPPHIAETLREQESRMAQTEAKTRDPYPLATMIYANGTTRKFNPEGFSPMVE